MDHQNQTAGIEDGLRSAGLLGSDVFNLWSPESVVFKSGADDIRRMGGFCSTERLDLQGEAVIQKGLSFERFINFGWFNDNHKQDTGAVVGVPETAFYKSPHGWYTEGIILKGHPPADRIWSLAKSLALTNRRLGFSIEGKVLERRQGYKIAKAEVRNVAVTNAPVNVDCSWGILAKSFCLNPLVSEDNCQCCVESAVKALEVGHDVVPTEGGRVLVPQDLEGGDPRTTTYSWKCPEEGCHRVFAKGGELQEHLDKVHVEKSLASTAEIRRPAKILRGEEAVGVVRQITGWSEPLARRVVQFAAESYQKQHSA